MLLLHYGEYNILLVVFIALNSLLRYYCVQEHLVKDSLALDFLMEVFVTWKQEKGLASLMTALKRGGIESRLMEFVPLNKRTEEHFRAAFEEKRLADIVKLHKAQVNIPGIFV